MPTVFSEVMRDVDLFTGVASIGSDSAWGQLEAAPFQEYWTAFSFGERNGQLKHKSILEHLIRG